MNLLGLEKPQIYTPIREIVIQSPKKFEKTISGFLEVSPFPEYNIHNAIKSTEPKFTQNANTCAILGMSNGKQTYLGHYAPELKTSKFKQQLEYDVKKMQDETGALSAIVTGGYDRNVHSGMNSVTAPQIRDSFTQLAEIGEILDKAGANLTMIAGKLNPEFKEHLAITGDRFILTHNPNKINSKLPELSKCKTDSEIERTLENQYSIVEIDLPHKIYYEG